jgi:hypothetical protein
MAKRIRALGNLINLKFIYVAIIHCVLTIFMDFLVFDSSRVFNNFKYFIIKFLAFIFIFVFWQTVNFLYKQFRNKNEKYMALIKHFSVYFGIMFVFLILTYPGVWRSDDIKVYEFATRIEFEYWQHFLMTVFDIFSMMIIPFPVGIVIMQVVFISLIVAYIISKCEMLFMKSKLVNLMYIPFLLPAIIDNNLFPLRMSIYSFLVLLFFTNLIFMFRERSKITWFNIFFWCLLITVIASWRSEAIYYVLLAPIVILLIFRKDIGFKKVIILFLITLIFTSSINHIQSRGIKIISNDTYKLTGILEPLAALMKTELKGNDLNKHLANIDKVVDVELLKTHGGMDAAFYQGGLRQNYTDKDYNNMLKSFAYLTLNNILPVFKSRLNVFMEASGYKSKPDSTILNSSELFKMVYPYDQIPYIKGFISNKWNKPLNLELREKTIKILENRRLDNYYIPIPLYSVFYNVIPSIFIMLFFIIYYLFKRVWGIASLFILILGVFPLIFFTTPAPYFMYYIPIYLCGYVYLTFFIISICMKRKVSNVIIKTIN